MTERRIVDLSSERLTLDETGPRWVRIAAVAAVVGILASAGLAMTQPDGGRRFYHAYLVNFVFFISLSLGALFFTLIQHLTHAGWSVAIRRIAEVVAKNLLMPVPVLVLPVLIGMTSLYPWTNPEVVAHDPLVAAKVAWLNTPFFLVRTFVYLAVWGVLARYFFARSTEQDQTGNPELTRNMERASAPGMLLFALTTTFFAFDFLMSLKPQWASTIFGVYFFAGCLVGFFALHPVLVRLVQGAGRMRGVVNVEHFHDMGKLTFAFVVFWAYIGFSQYMLMWYANLPEETVWYSARTKPGWAWMSWLILFGHFVLPFVFLLSRHVKRRTATLLAGCAWMLAMHWMDVYWMVMPQAYPERPPLGAMDLAVFLAVGGVYFTFVVRRLARHSLVPLRDPRLAESLKFENV